MPIWDDVVPPEDMAVYRAGGYGKPQGFGARPALLIVDVNYHFVGHAPQPILESVAVWRNSCGQRGWEAIPRIASLLDAARAARIPVVYTTAARLPQVRGLRPGKNYRSGDRPSVPGFAHQGTDIVEALAPREDELLIRKHRASAFFGTPLLSVLHGHQIDTVLVAGTTTSGCVRATVVEGHSYDFRMSVVEECVFDRWTISHKVALFDLHAKYADVVPLADTLAYLARVAERETVGAPREGG